MVTFARWSHEAVYGVRSNSLVIHRYSNGVLCRAEAYEFEHLRLAFEVRLEMLDDAALQTTSKEWHSNASPSPMYKLHANQEDWVFSYLCLNTSSR